MKTKICLITVLAPALLFTPSSARAGDNQIQTYSVPKDHPKISAPADSVSVPEAGPATLHWTTPTGWQELPPTSIRVGNFTVPGKNDAKAEVAITSFPGAVGTELGNVNRWRAELGLPSVDASQVSSEEVTVDSIKGRLYDLSGKSLRTVVVALPRGGLTWFFKLRGDAETVAAAKPAFAEFLKTIRFGAAESPAMAPAGMVPGGADPHAGLGIAPPPAIETASGPEPKWSPPASWVSTAPGMMLVKAFSIAGDQGQKATVAISSFPGDVGGTFMNVNRWRSQMGLPEIPENGLAKVTETVKVEGGKGTLVDFASPGGKTTRLVAVMVPRADCTWFYKLTGDEAVVGREKAAFVKFVQTVHYPQP